MHKRGELTLKGIVELLVVAVVLFALLYVAYQTGTQEYYAKQKIVKNAAAFVNAFQGMKGNAWVVDDITPATALILTAQKAEVPHDKYPITKSFAAQGIIENRIDKQKIYFYKSGPDISITDTMPTLKKFDCGGQYTLNVNNPLIKSTVVGQRYFIDNNACTQDNRCARSNKAFQQAPDFVVKVIPMTTQGIAIRYPPSSPESKKAACALANKINEENTWLLPTNDPEVVPKGLLIESNGVGEDLIASALRDIIKLTEDFS